ncbi:nuclear transport factor 2 family protein [Streptomyces sp. NPDC091292]|uniref:nuclear transport factor 2 family protein n=1 Tax=Streptomyces sp. NPDC091292 TaxID=3365991 RepID=UPI0038111817
MNTPDTDLEQVEAANTAFYEAMEEGDFDAVSDLWLNIGDLPEGYGASGHGLSGTSDVSDMSDEDDASGPSGDEPAISCVHPGWPVLTGRGEVLRSYALIMANTEYIQFFLTDVQVSVFDGTALVTCTENILSGGPAPEGGEELGPLVGQLVVATNVFRRTPGGWKLWSHHASPVLAETSDDETDDTPS